MTSPRQRSFPAVLVTLLAAFAAGACGSNSSNPSGAGGSGAGGSGAGGQAGAAPGVGGAAGAGTGGVAGAGAGGAAGRAPDGGTDSDAGDAQHDATVPDTGAGDVRTDAGNDTGDGGVAFNPCPATGTCIIMPLGDSITEGFPTFVGGYRVELFSRAVLANKAITFVGRRSNGPASGMVQGKTFPPGCEGYSGFTIDDETGAGGPMGIQPLVNPAITMFHPHIILMMIGTNDINGNFAVATAPTRLGALIDQITTAAPSALLVVAQIIPTTVDATNARFVTYNAAIPALVSQRAAAGKHVQLVNMYAAFTAHADFKTSLMTDTLHPNAAGYTLMGDTWYGVIAGLLPPAP